VVARRLAGKGQRVYGQVVAEPLGVLEDEGHLVEVRRPLLPVGDGLEPVAVGGRAEAGQRLARLPARRDEDDVARKGRCALIWRGGNSGF
jgi:hypothetical protein